MLVKNVVIYIKMLHCGVALASSNNFWSSSEYSSNNARNLNTNNGNVNNNNNKNNSYRVRPFARL